jgi:glucuronate isomerase
MATTAPFIHANFLLDSKAARKLYHGYAANAPIVDYHCHLPPEDVAGDRRFRDMSDIWLGGDHYKWRAMRTNGIDERRITGDAPAREKFQAWAETVPKCLRNPLYHWTHLELNRPFGIHDRRLDGDSAENIWKRGNQLLASDGFSARGIMTRMNVAAVCTTDDPVDSLEHHLALAKEQAAGSSFTCQMRPTWRPDKVLTIDDPVGFNAWIDRLSAAADTDISDLASLRLALAKRHAFFHAAGCRLSDHGLETIYAEPYSEAQVRSAFATARSGGTPDPLAVARFRSCLLYEGALMDHAAGWVQQFHLGALRNNNQRLFQALGPDKGFDSIGDFSYGQPLSRFLDRLDGSNQLAKTILYNLHPKDNEMLATMIGNFQDGSVPGKLQFGSGWWFLDQLDGMNRQLDALSSLSLLSRFIGMLTDSRSFLSYTRHEYFRRLLCNKLGDEIERGLLPNDLDLVGNLVLDVSYRNAAGYFDFGLPSQPPMKIKRKLAPASKNASTINKKATRKKTARR